MYWRDDMDGDVPCVVMGHGGSATKRLGLPSYAQAFASRGMAVLAFDYRHFGASGATPPSHRRGRTAGRLPSGGAVRARPQRDRSGSRRALGTSLSGGHLLAVAAQDSRIAAVVTQVPMIDGWHRGRTLRERMSWEVTWRTARSTAAAIRDVSRARKGAPPYFVPVVAERGRVAVFTEPEAKRTFEALGGEGVGWRNALAPRFIFSLPRYRKGTAEQLHMPVLMCLADHDLQSSSRYAAHIASLMPNVEIHRYPVGHFDVYLGSLRDEITATQVAFLERHLNLGAAMTNSTQAGT